ncbi:MAG TPA: hypothetical protein DDW65_13660 [Firmicutes bacterium]|jgi:hypothetical protein|nr:hypothetical protein [Bacillota bacterium]
MNPSQDLLEKMALPYYAHCQARIAPALHSIAWNKVALSCYIDIAILLKGVEPPTSYLRKIRSFYDNYGDIATSHPLLGDLDALSRNLIHLDKANNNALTAFAVKWNSIIHVLEAFCFELLPLHHINDPDQIAETLQSLVYAMIEERTLPRWSELLEQQQSELSRLFQLKNLPSAALSKVHFKYQYSANYQSDQQWLIDLIQSDQELQDAVVILNKNFLRLVNLINEKVPEPDRRLQVHPVKPETMSPSQDYRLTVTYSFDGNDEGEYRANFFPLLRNFLK